MAKRVDTHFTAREDVSKAAAKAAHGVTGLNKTVKDAKKIFQGSTLAIGAAVAAMYTAARAVGALIQAYREQEQAETKLSAALLATGGAVGITKDEMIRYAAELQKVTRFGDETIINAQGLMTTFTQIGSTVFPRAIEAAADMSTMFGQDLQQSVIQLGTALNDPIQGIGRLRRIGISFTEAQKEQIRTLTESGQVMEAQKVILAEIEREFGGVARAAGTTATAAIDQLKNAWSDLKEEGGRVAAEGIEPVARALTVFIRKASEAIRRVREMREALKELEKAGSVEGIKNTDTAITALTAKLELARESLKTLEGSVTGHSASLNTLIKERKEEIKTLETQIARYAEIARWEAIGEQAAKEGQEAAAARAALEAQRLRELATWQERVQEMYAKTAEGKRAELDAEIAFYEYWLPRSEVHKTQIQNILVMLYEQRAALEGVAEAARELTDVWSGLNVEFLKTEGLLPRLNNSFFGLTDILSDYVDRTTAIVPMTEAEVEAYIAQTEAVDAVTAGMNRMAAAKRDYLLLLQGTSEEEQEILEDQERMYRRIASVIADSMAQSFMALGEALVNAETGWESLKEAATEAIAGILQALGHKAIAEAADAIGAMFKDIAAFNYVGAAANAAAAAKYGVAAALAYAGAGAVRALAGGGWITEPVVGVGTSTGQRYLMGEAGPEYVGSPGRGMTINIQGSVITERELLYRIERERKRTYRGY